MIATLTGQAEAAGLEVTILTGDLDMLQLVSERTRLMVSLRGGVANTVAYDLAKIDERWGLRPDQMLDYKSLKGDPTDNIPGIPGVGEKTASKLIATWGSLDALYEHLDEVMPEKLRPLLAEHSETVLESRELMRLVRDVDVVLDPERGRVGEYDREAVVRIFREYEFRTLIDRLPPLTGERPEDAVGAMRELREAGFPAAQGRGGGRGAAPGGGHGTAGAGRPDDGSLQLSMDFDVVSGGGSAPAHAVAATSPAVEARAEALAQASGTCRGHWPRRSWTRGGSRSPTRHASRPWSRGCGSRTPWASRSSWTTRGRSRAPRSPSPSRARTAVSWRRRGPRRPSRCGISWSGSARRSLATRSSRCSPRASPRIRTRRRCRSRSTPRSPPTS